VQRQEQQVEMLAIPVKIRLKQEQLPNRKLQIKRVHSLICCDNYNQNNFTIRVPSTLAYTVDMLSSRSDDWLYFNSRF
jgi:hypothetical protein